MSETLLGVIIGGVIASITPIATLIYDFYKWKKEIKINNLRRKRDELDKLFKEVHDKLNEGMTKNSFSSEMISNFEFIFPTKVFEAFDSMMKEKDRSDDNMRKHFYFIMRAMKECLAEIDENINKILS